MNGWPARVDADLQPYFGRRLELTTNSGCLMWGMRVIIPPKLRPRLLDELHATHTGVVRMKSLAKLHMWWPKISKSIEKLVRECESCQSHSKNPPRVVLHPWAWPSGPFQRIHIDFAGPYLGQMFLVVVDAYHADVRIYVVQNDSGLARAICQIRLSRIISLRQRHAIYFDGV
eukprot:m.294125 g.294125  ORF g.294125 m.294125 type:complete len:173 (+) comp40742_c0_seq59:3091-3609(+)